MASFLSETIEAELKMRGATLPGRAGGLRLRGGDGLRRNGNSGSNGGRALRLQGWMAVLRPLGRARLPVVDNMERDFRGPRQLTHGAGVTLGEVAEDGMPEENEETITMGAPTRSQIPEFSAEDDKEGLKARGYLRKIEAWRRVTRLKPTKQALMLYNSLTGKAWRDAEDLDLAALDCENGVENFKSWVMEKYLDKEVVKVGEYLTEFFKTLKKAAGQDIREFNTEFDRQLSKLKEVGCVLPDTCVAWLYLDKLRLDNVAELSLLSSTGNLYQLQRLREAAVIQDRGNRRLWETSRHVEREKTDKERFQKSFTKKAYVTMHEENGGEVEHDEEEGDDVFPEDEEPTDSDEETKVAYVAFQNAKAKYQSALRARGTTAAKDDRIKLAKARSYCSVCKQKGHWHKDPECPANKKGATGGGPHGTHIVFFPQSWARSRTAHVRGF